MLSFFKKSIQSNVVLQPACRATFSSGGGAKPHFFSQIADIRLVMLNLFQQFTHLSYSFQVCKVLKQVQDESNGDFRKISTSKEGRCRGKCNQFGIIPTNKERRCRIY